MRCRPSHSSGTVHRGDSASWEGFDAEWAALKEAHAGFSSAPDAGGRDGNWLVNDILAHVAQVTKRYRCTWRSTMLRSESRPASSWR